MESLSKFIRSAWVGKERLWVVYWLCGHVLGMVLALLLFVLVPTSPVTTPLALILGLVYMVWIVVSVWRCAPNANRPFWGYLARTVWVVAVPLTLAGMFKMLDRVMAISWRW